jgi:hypothetical protein
MLHLPIINLNTNYLVIIVAALTLLFQLAQHVVATILFKKTSALKKLKNKFRKYPEAKVARMDYDSVKGKNAHDALIKI